MAGSRILELQRDDRCVGCEVALQRGVRAWWDATAKTVSCLGCAPVTEVNAPMTASGPPEAPADVIVDFGVAGRSANREYERKLARRERDVRSRYPVIGGALLALFGPPQHTRAWAAGAKGEAAVGLALDGVRDRGVVALHDRHQNGTRSANIDHVAIGPSGIYVIDAKWRETGRVEKRPEGPIFNRGPGRLYVGGRNETALIEKMAGQVSAVRSVLQTVPGAGVVPIHPMVVFVNAEWGWLASPFEIGGVWVGWRKPMAERVARAGPMGHEGIAILAQALAERLRPA